MKIVTPRPSDMLRVAREHPQLRPLLLPLIRRACAVAGLTPTAHAWFHRELPEYKLDVLAEADASGVPTAEALEGAARVYRALERGIQGNADLCKLDRGMCRGNLGLPRSSMPQAPTESVAELLASDDEGDRTKGRAAVAAGAGPGDSVPLFDQVLARVRADGPPITRRTLPVGSLRATQREIKAAKVVGMADSWLRGDYDPAGEALLVSREGYVFDGHHRWAALLMVSPGASMPVQQVGMPMLELLRLAHGIPGVFRMDLQDRSVPVTAPLDLGRVPGELWQQGSDWYGKNAQGACGGPFPERTLADRYVSGVKVACTLGAPSVRGELVRWAHRHPEWREVLLPLVVAR